MLKKTLIALVMILTVAALTACGESKQPETTTPETTTPAETTPEETTTPPETTTPEETTPAVELPEGIVAPEKWLAEPKNATVASDGDLLSLRMGPDVSYDAIDGLPDGTEISIEAEQDEWGFVNYNDQYGWISMEFVTE